MREAYDGSERKQRRRLGGFHLEVLDLCSSPLSSQRTPSLSNGYLLYWLSGST